MDKLKIDLECPNCHYVFNYKAEEIRPGNSTVCVKCNSTIKFTGDDLRKLQESIDALYRDLKDAFKEFHITF